MTVNESVNPKGNQPAIVAKKPKVWSLSQVLLVACVGVFVLMCVLPFINVLAVSLSSKSAILAGRVSFWPVEFNWTAYEVIFGDKSLIHCLFYTIEMTVIYTAIAMLLTILMAYPLTKKRLGGRKVFNFLALFTMYFSGGTIPIFLNIQELGLYNTMWALILPGVLSTYNMIILKSFFAALPTELEEAATIDGANDFQILVQVYLPLSLASIATLTLFYAVGKWNSFSDALYYTTTKSLQPLQLRLYNLVKGTTSVELNMVEGSSADLGQRISESIKSATIIFATLPILVVYPFVQRYFISGVTIGAVKG